MAPKILLVDSETAPSLAWVWAKWQTNVIAFKKDWFMLSFAWKWLGDTKIQYRGLSDYPNYKKDKSNDRCLVSDLWNVLDCADVVIAHNGDRFDIRKSNARFLFHSLGRPSPFQTVDTLKVAKSAFRLDGNSLNDICKYLNIGGKLPNTGFHLWQGCMNGDPESWKMMEEYNKHDVYLLDLVYHRMRSFAKNHPNLQLYTKTDCCPTCQSMKVQKRGFAPLKKLVKQRWTCTDCGSWWTGKVIK